MNPVAGLITLLSLIGTANINRAEWVVHVPRGKEAVQRMAEDHGLEVLGEVLPDTFEYHVRPGVSNARGKRSVVDHQLYDRQLHHVEKRILTHSDVNWAERQEPKVCSLPTFLKRTMCNIKMYLGVPHPSM